MVKELLAHEAVVALFMIHGQVAVFVQVKGAHTGEIQNAALTQADQLLIGGNGGGAGGKPQHGIRLGNNLRGNQRCGGLTDLGGGVVKMNLHDAASSGYDNMYIVK